MFKESANNDLIEPIQGVHENTILELFNTQVNLRPDHVAVQIGTATLTYKELSDRADKLALGLIELGVKTDSMVAILLPRSLELIISIFGILKAGGAYIPIGPKDGAERIGHILNDAKAKVLVTQKEYLQFEPNNSVLEINLYNDEWLNPLKVTPQESLDKPLKYPVKIEANSLAYVVYTSGTTGKPKGALIEHRNLYSLIVNYLPKLDNTDRTLQTNSPACDASSLQIFPSLCNGGTLILWENDLSTTIREEKITYTCVTPSMSDLLTTQDCTSLKNLVIGGEKLTAEVVNKIPSHVKIYNGYGPTECTVVCSHTLIEDPNKIHIGGTLKHCQVYVVKEDLSLCNAGEEGELLIGGDGVGRGYLNRPKLSREKFIPNPFGPGKVYRTGDLVKWNKDSELHFLGRIDRQVKVRGFRVELDGLEKLISSFEGVTNAHVMLDGQNLIAFVTPLSVNLTELKKYLKSKVPFHALPSSITQMKSFPVNTAGKVDERNLPKPKKELVEKKDLPKTSEEKKLAKIWNEILNQEVSIRDNFFDLGGNSLDVLKLTHKLKEEFNPEISSDLVYANPNFFHMIESIFKSSSKEIITESRASNTKILFDFIKCLPTFAYDVFFNYGPFIVFIILFILSPLWALSLAALEYLIFRFYKFPDTSIFRRFRNFISSPHKRFNSVKIIEEIPIEKIGRTAYILTPHGITDDHFLPVEQLLLKRGLKYRGVHHAIYFNFPFCKAWYSLNKGVPGNKESYYLAEKEGFSIMAALGDREALRFDEPGFMDQSNHKVFFKYSLETGTSLTPIYIHGGEKAFTPFKHFTREKFKIFQKNSLIINPFWGRWFLHIPHKVDIKITFGKPIEVSKVEDPSWNQVEGLYNEYVNSLRDLYKKHAPIGAPNLKVY